MRQALSVSLPAELAAALNRVTREIHLTRSEVVKLALRDFMRRYEMEDIRGALVPRARSRGIFTDEDVFRKIRS